MKPSARIVFEYGEATTQVVELDTTQEYTLGREKGCSIVVEEKSVSRKHLRVSYEDGSWWLRNISHTNAIALEGRVVHELRPAHGDTFKLGRVTCTFAEAGRELGDYLDGAMAGEREEPAPSAAGPAEGPAPLEEAAPSATEEVPTPQPIVSCPVCGSMVQIIDFASIEDLDCHVCRARLGRLAIRHLEVSGIYDSVALRTEARSDPGRVIGEYRILHELGSGGMGKVFKARDASADLYVALKLLYPRDGQEETFARSFENEARALARIHHRNIVRIYRFGMHGDVYYIAMEFLQGTDVRKMIQERRKLRVDESIEALRQSLVGLDRIHQAGLIHRDVKPSNILVGEDGVVKLVDFGIVQLGETKSPDRATFVAGTVEYLSPEAIRGQPLGPPADLYSLGVTLFYMLCGQRPFKGSSREETLKMHVEEQPPHPGKFRDLPPELVAILARLLAKDVRDRYAKATDVLDDLDAMELGHSLNRQTAQLGRRWK